MKHWLPYLLIPVCVAALWWTPWAQEYIDDSVEVAVVKRYEAREKLVPGPHEHAYDQEAFFAEPAPPDTVWVEDGRIALEPLSDAVDDHAHFGVNDSSGVVYEVTSFMDWLLDTDRINALGMLVLVVGTALSKVVAMMVKAVKGRGA